jgi:hypothetical protein
MRSRATRLTLGITALIALAVAGFLAVDADRRIGVERDALRAFDSSARETVSALGDIRVAQQAYVAAGQGTDYWKPKVAALVEQVTPQIDRLRASAASTQARESLMEAASRVTEIGNVDRRVLDYLRSGQMLMASDIVFTEGGETAANASQLVETARQAEQQAFDASEAALRRRQAAILGGAVGFCVFVVLAFAWTRPVGAAEPQDSTSSRTSLGDLSPKPAAQQKSNERGASAQTGLSRPASSTPRGSAPMLHAAADVCTDLSRATTAADLTRLLSRTADIIDANGIVVWLGDNAGGDLRLVLAHGYSEPVLARMGTIPRGADNAAAAAYRSGKLQIVLKRPGGANGAVAAPLLAVDGCIGALTAEIQAGSEVSEAIQAITSLVAAQLTGILAASLAAQPQAESGRIASA